MKYFTIISLLFLVFSYIDEPCDSGPFEKGVCVEKSSCTLYGKQRGEAYYYDWKTPEWSCPNDPPDVICCVKRIAKLRDGTIQEGKCLNVRQCKGSVVDTFECPGSDNVKLCVKKEANRIYKVSDLVNKYGGTLRIKNPKGLWIGNILAGQYIFSIDIEGDYVKFYKGYLNGLHLTKGNLTKANYKVNVDRLNFRDGPGTIWNILKTLDYGTKIIYYSRDPWYPDWAVTNEGYCHASYISEINDPTPPPPIPTPPSPTPNITNAGDISTKFKGTLLTRSSFINKVSSYCENHKGEIAQALCNNAGIVYDVSKSSDVNALLVIVRAMVEGNSPGASNNNYWGIKCYNGAKPKDCASYKSLEDGVRGFADTISKYNNLAEMLSKYVYIGKFWYNPGSASVGGCYYFPYIKQYMSPQRSNTVSYICNKSSKCAIGGGDCIPTIDEDQRAYSTWQVEKKMTPTIRNVFGVYKN